MKKKEKTEPKKRGRKTNKEREAILAAQQQAAEVSEKEILEAAEPVHTDVVETEVEREEEKQEEPKKPKNPYVTLRELLTDFDDIDRERCRNQAKALWEMYYGGDLYCQTLAIPCQGGGVFKKKVLYSHKSHLAV